MKQVLVIVMLLAMVGAGLVYVAYLAVAVNTQSYGYTPEELVWLREHDRRLEVLFGYEAPPNAYTDKNGNYVGLMVDYFQEIERNMDMRIRFHMVGNWNALMEYAKTHKDFIVVGIADTEERREFLSFTEPFVKIPYIIVTGVNSPVRNMEDLAGKTVTTVKQYAVNDYLRAEYPEIRIREVVDNLMGLRAVVTGQCDAMIINQAYATYIIEVQGLTGLKIVGESGYMNYLAAACSSGDEMLARILKKAVLHITEARHKELFRRWVFPETGYVHISEESFRLIWIFGIFIVLAGVGVWLLLVSLRATVRRQTVTIREDYNRLKTTENSLRQNEQKLSAALNRITFHVHNSPLGVVEWNNRGRITGWSPQAELIFGWRMEEVLGRTIDEWRFVHEADLARVRRNTEELLQGGQSQAISENRNYAKDGSVVHCRWYNSILQDEHGQVLSMLSQVENVTESRLAEQELVRAKEVAEAASAAKSEFLANMSHEIRTPLNGIQGMLQILQTTELKEEQEAYVNKAIDSSRRLTQLLGDILDLSRIEAGKMVLQSEEFDPSAVADSIRLLFEPSALEKNIDFTVRCQESMPRKLRGDAVRLRQILLNLVGNAIKFTEPGGRVSVWGGCFGNSAAGKAPLNFVVEDSGVGMNQETITNLLETFAPGEVSYRRKYEGAGLGLAIVVRLVRLMGGSVCISSEPRKGAEVGCTVLAERL